VERYVNKCSKANERIVELEHEIEKVSEAYQEVFENQDRRIQAMGDLLTRTEELLATGSTELSGTQSSSSTASRLSEAEVLGIVRDLNENVFQVAANLTEEWEKLGSSRSSQFTITQNDVEALSRFYGPALIQSGLNRNPAAVTLLVQSCICHIIMQITSWWRHDQELATLGPVYQGLSASESREISERWKSLTHSYLSQPPPRSTSIAQHVADIIYLTGSFPSHRRSVEFVKTAALSGIETIDRLVQRLEFAFMVEVASSDMSLLFETPHTVFDNTRMTNELGSNEASAPGGQDKVAGTMEVGVGKGKGWHMEVLLKAKVILEMDVAEL